MPDDLVASTSFSVLRSPFPVPHFFLPRRASAISPRGATFVAMTGETSSQMALRDPDIRLMLRVRDDDDSAFGELVELYHQRLVTVMHHLVGRGDEAEDL